MAPGPRAWWHRSMSPTRLAVGLVLLVVETVPVAMPATLLVPVEFPVHIDWILALCDRCITHDALSICLESLIVYRRAPCLDRQNPHRR